MTSPQLNLDLALYSPGEMARRLDASALAKTEIARVANWFIYPRRMFIHAEYERSEIWHGLVLGHPWPNPNSLLDHSPALTVTFLG
jgi:hypothetical protein